MTVAELLARMSSRELTEWLCYFTLEGPPGEERADWRAGMVASTIANVNRDPKKRREPFTPKDFMPSFDNAQDAGRSQTVEQQAGMARMLSRVLGGKIETGDPATAVAADDR